MKRACGLARAVEFREDRRVRVVSGRINFIRVERALRPDQRLGEGARIRVDARQQQQRLWVAGRVVEALRGHLRGITIPALPEQGVSRGIAIAWPLLGRHGSGHQREVRQHRGMDDRPE